MVVGTLARLRVLFVDDDPSGLAQVQRLVRKKRDAWSMSFAADASSAVSRLETTWFDAVVTGCLAGTVGGIELLHVVEARWPHVARVLLAKSLPPPHQMGPVHAFLLVPVEDDLVCDIVEELATAAQEGHALHG